MQLSAVPTHPVWSGLPIPLHYGSSQRHPVLQHSGEFLAGAPHAITSLHQTILQLANGDTSPSSTSSLIQPVQCSAASKSPYSSRHPRQINVATWVAELGPRQSASHAITHLPRSLSNPHPLTSIPCPLHPPLLVVQSSSSHKTHSVPIDTERNPHGIIASTHQSAPPK